MAIYVTVVVTIQRIRSRVDKMLSRHLASGEIFHINETQTLFASGVTCCVGARCDSCVGSVGTRLIGIWLTGVACCVGTSCDSPVGTRLSGLWLIGSKPPRVGTHADSSVGTRLSGRLWLTGITCCVGTRCDSSVGTRLSGL